MCLKGATYTQFPSQDFPSQDLFQGLGCPETFLLIGSLTAALRLSKGWVRKFLNLVMGIGCKQMHPLLFGVFGLRALGRLGF